MSTTSPRVEALVKFAELTLKAKALKQKTATLPEFTRDDFLRQITQVTLAAQKSIVMMKDPIENLPAVECLKMQRDYAVQLTSIEHTINNRLASNNQDGAGLELACHQNI